MTIQVPAPTFQTQEVDVTLTCTGNAAVTTLTPTTVVPTGSRAVTYEPTPRTPTEPTAPTAIATPTAPTVQSGGSFNS
eukprot:CAMPEP_0201570184 /NCGR_PEP_ID=MMETSP0190_2-20130828/12318_1 /ASSEMBLY_ACC=CAM_ASM_000263 /TAXON_ID=37353 /ORGANISM="Rosalina sp." /LENGTH=77 /DNA_ID=CAMNT_0047993439 /DNA_START=290 /DNA_END=519 /DNA_ORIENTATION=-